MALAQWSARLDTGGAAAWGGTVGARQGGGRELTHFMQRECGDMTHTTPLSQPEARVGRH
jgi:hypothetical protein